jgi:ubiquinone/menaquinone biosynthesis C-methylase UbiE
LPQTASHHETKAAAQRQFDSWAGWYDRSILNQLLFRPGYEVLLEELVLWRGDDPTPFRVLDVGCGTGTLAGLIVGSSLPASAVGLDYAVEMCRAAATKAAAGGIAERARFTNGDSEHLPFADDSFDVVACANSFHHYPHQDAVIREFARVVRPGGRVMLVDGFRDNLIGWVVFDAGVASFEKGVHHAPWPQVRGYFQAAGLQHIRQRKYGVWAPLLVTVGVRV